MNILHINTTDIGGGAEQAMMDVHNALVAGGHQSHCLVGFKRSDWPFVSEWETRGTFQQMRNSIDKAQGREAVEFPSVIKQIEKLDFKPDVIHIHNLHGDYFDLRELPDLSKKHKVSIHLHDMWLLTGHCAQPMACPKWRGGCGNCPDLDIYPAIKKDATAFNWKRKREILNRSTLHFICPSQWIAKQGRISDVVYQSVKVIPNGVDTSIFKPADRLEARKKLGLDENKLIILFCAKNPKKNEFKDYETLEKAIYQVAQKFPNREIELLCLGGHPNNTDSHWETTGQYDNLTISTHPFVHDRKQVAQYYQAADLYAHPAKTETFGKTIIEAMACGLPVIATNVGGVPEIIGGMKASSLVESGDMEQMRNAIVDSLLNLELKRGLAMQDWINFGSKFDVTEVSKELLLFYESLLSF